MVVSLTLKQQGMQNAFCIELEPSRQKTNFGIYPHENPFWKHIYARNISNQWQSQHKTQIIYSIWHLTPIILQYAFIITCVHTKKSWVLSTYPRNWMGWEEITIGIMIRNSKDCFGIRFLHSWRRLYSCNGRCKCSCQRQWHYFFSWTSSCQGLSKFTISSDVHVCCYTRIIWFIKSCNVRHFYWVLTYVHPKE